MTETRKAVLDVCSIAEGKSEWSFSKNAIRPDYDLTDIDDWKKFVKEQGIHALYRYGKQHFSSVKRTVQETIQFKEFHTRDAVIVTAIFSWVEKNFQMNTIHLQTASCTRAFGNIY
ncbi:MAG: hypothetical protein IJK26_09840 [Clostridia bacterium]|nr:hypothetical protein [Clostridia bacterium]